MSSFKKPMSNNACGGNSMGSRQLVQMTRAKRCARMRFTDDATKEWIGLLAYRLAGYTSELLPGPEEHAARNHEDIPALGTGPDQLDVEVLGGGVGDDDRQLVARCEDVVLPGGPQFHVDRCTQLMSKNRAKVLLAPEMLRAVVNIHQRCWI